MQIKKIMLVLGWPLLLTSCQDPFFENTSSTMPSSATVGGYPAKYGQPRYSTEQQHHSNQGGGSYKSNSSNEESSSGSSDSSSGTSNPPPANTTPMIPDSTPMI